MPVATQTNIPISGVQKAKHPLREVPYSHAVSILINKNGWRLFPLESAIACQQRIIEDAEFRELDRVDREEFEAAPKRIDELQLKRTQLIAQYQMDKTIESCSQYHGSLVAGSSLHPIIATLHAAFVDHRPVCLSPDMIWLMILQGVAQHINAIAETMRSRFVNHSEKQTLIVRRDDFVKGSPENPWAEVFPEFTEQIRRYVGDEISQFFASSYSTTGPVERAAFAVTFLDAMQSYFTYDLYTLCGIPEITLEGTVDDWRALRHRTDQLLQFGLEGWVRVLDPILKRFVDAAEGNAEPRFWQSIFRYQSRSGGNSVTGWITAFFPYLHREIDQHEQSEKELRPVSQILNGQIDWTSEETMQQCFTRSALGEPVVDTLGNVQWKRVQQDIPELASFPSGLSSAPLNWMYLKSDFKMRMYAGLVGFSQDSKTMALRPEIGWAICDETSF